MFRLKIQSVDDDPEELEFPILDAAIAHAKAWFVDGYKSMPEMQDEVRRDAEELERDIRAGREFYCSRFFETVSVKGQ